MTDAEILEGLAGMLSGESSCFNDTMHGHFIGVDDWTWCRIADEGLRILNLVTGKDHDEFESPIPSIIIAVAAQSQQCGIYAVAAALGVDGDTLYDFMDAWLENKKDAPKPLSVKKFIKTMRKRSAQSKHLEWAAKEKIVYQK